MGNRDFSPITPGEILEEEFLVPMKLSQYRVAKDIHVSPSTNQRNCKGESERLPPIQRFDWAIILVPQLNSGLIYRVAMN